MHEDREAGVSAEEPGQKREGISRRGVEGQHRPDSITGETGEGVGVQAQAEEPAGAGVEAVQPGVGGQDQVAVHRNIAERHPAGEEGLRKEYSAKRDDRSRQGPETQDPSFGRPGGSAQAQGKRELPQDPAGRDHFSIEGNEG